MNIVIKRIVLEMTKKKKKKEITNVLFILRFKKECTIKFESGATDPENILSKSSILSSATNMC